MNDFLGRLARRSVRSEARSRDIGSIEPRQTGRFETSGFTVERASRIGETTADLQEEHAEIIVQPTRSREARQHVHIAQPHHPPIEPEQSLSPKETAKDALKDTSRMIEPRLRTSVIDLESVHAPQLSSESSQGSPTEESSGLQPKSDPIVAQLLVAPQTRHNDDDNPKSIRQSITDPVAAPADLLDPVVEVHHVPGPVVVIERRVSTPPQRVARRPQQPSHPPASSRRQEPRKVVFETREPLAPLGFEPLQVREIMDHANSAAEISAESVVHVHIGRMEVSREAPAAAVPAPPPKRSAVLSLDQYLEQRSAKATGQDGRW